MWKPEINIVGNITYAIIRCDMGTFLVCHLFVSGDMGTLKNIVQERKIMVQQNRTVDDEITFFMAVNKAGFWTFQSFN
ncbi:MAG: hypothetical protein GX660_22940 [Clostridiaceae bacterium]|nr:hypothetical protein [Clostridiaceae bacterium]